MPSEQQLGTGWYKVLKPVFETDWWKKLHKSVWAAAPNIRPDPKNIFRAFRETPLEKLRVIVIGQDPYPSGTYADGLAFSSGNGQLPKSLEYIYRELRWEYNDSPKGYDLSPWAHQGVLLLNTSLTVTTGMANSHAEYGWIRFIDEVIAQAVDYDPGTIIVAWGKPANSVVMSALSKLPNGVEVARNMVTGVHPIAESYSDGKIKFVGGGYFKRINELLRQQGRQEINWIF